MSSQNNSDSKCETPETRNNAGFHPFAKIKRLRDSGLMIAPPNLIV
jgi:hypothetical protein